MHSDMKKFIHFNEFLMLLSRENIIFSHFIKTMFKFDEKYN